jgi:hypothetical protein
LGWQGKRKRTFSAIEFADLGLGLSRTKLSVERSWLIEPNTNIIASTLFRRLEQLNRVTRGIVENDLRTTGTSDDVITERKSGTTKAIYLNGKVIDLYVNAIPSSWNRLATVGHGSTTGAGFSAPAIDALRHA